MKQISQNYRSGAIRLENVDAPALGAGQVLVRSLYSVISTGTESMKVREGKLSLLGKAMARPDHLKKVFESIKQNGLLTTIEKALNKLDSLTPLGYSLSGVVVGVGAGVAEFAIGQRVACAGAGYANHAEVNVVPKNLVVPVPDGVDMRHAAFATIGSIAMQGFRQSELHLGETCCVIGLGLIGQLLTQILVAAGVTVIGLDPSRPRCEVAKRLGARAALDPNDGGRRASVAALTAGAGADCVIITAGGRSNAPIDLAVELARDRARIVDIGMVSMDVNWKDAYEKELDIRFSRSYGPGRYDPVYEEQGIDYPIGYVRWTERRNMASIIDLIAQKRMNLDAIISGEHAFADAEKVYDAIGAGAETGIGILFRYADAAKPEAPRVAASKPAAVGKMNLAVIGAGNYASSVLLPILAKDKRVSLARVITKTGLSAANAARRFPFQRTGTSAEEALNASDINAVLIATRHDSHADLAARALTAGKTVYVEKPLAIDRAGLEKIRKSLIASGNDRLFVGFNRRFSPAIGRVADFFRDRGHPLVVHYRVHAGQLEKDSWYADPSNGSRFAGEGGHFIDTLSCLIGSRPTSVFARSLKPKGGAGDDLSNLSITITYEDGSLGNILYLTQGSQRLGKERIEVFGGGKSAVVENFKLVRLLTAKKESDYPGPIDKGQRQAVDAFIGAALSGGPMPIAVDDLIDTTLTSLAVGESLSAGRAIMLSEFWDKP